MPAEYDMHAILADLECGKHDRALNSAPAMIRDLRAMRAQLDEKWSCMSCEDFSALKKEHGGTLDDLQRANAMLEEAIRQRNFAWELSMKDIRTAVLWKQRYEAERRAHEVTRKQLAATEAKLEEKCTACQQCKRSTDNYEREWLRDDTAWWNALAKIAFPSEDFSEDPLAWLPTGKQKVLKELEKLHNVSTRAEKYREALEFYADEGNWTDRAPDTPGPMLCAKVHADNGAIARAALADKEEK